MKTVLITGASRGLGEAIARTFAKNNYNIILNYNNNYESAMKLKQELETYNIEVLPIKCDMTDEEQIKNMVNLTIEKDNNIKVIDKNNEVLYFKYDENKKQVIYDDMLISGKDDIELTL